MEFEEYLYCRNISLKLCNLPSNIKGFAYYYSGKYLIVINCKCGYWQQRESFVHELIHILDNHLVCQKGNAHDCEARTKIIISELKKEVAI